MAIRAGTKLGRYEIRSKIGEGGMGEVYLLNPLVDESGGGPLTIVLNWTVDLKQ